LIWSLISVAFEGVILVGVYFAGLDNGRKAAFNDIGAFNSSRPLMPRPSNGVGVGP
jgi:hypothetical protein